MAPSRTVPIPIKRMVSVERPSLFVGLRRMSVPAKECRSESEDADGDSEPRLWCRSFGVDGHAESCTGRREPRDLVDLARVRSGRDDRGPDADDGAERTERSGVAEICHGTPYVATVCVVV